mmetsp:Transcript_40447/g.88429  ORF Transcript_40447/g.88429 Transcript_40447/m.88429 type:complete len:350 (-) Transcript_40447:429-1478(-)
MLMPANGEASPVPAPAMSMTSLAWLTMPSRLRSSTAASNACPSTHPGGSNGSRSSISVSTRRSIRRRGGAALATAPATSTPWSLSRGILRKTSRDLGSSSSAAARTPSSLLAVLFCRLWTSLTKGFLYGPRGSKGGLPGPLVALRRPLVTLRSDPTSLVLGSEHARIRHASAFHTVSSLLVDVALCLRASSEVSKQPKRCSLSSNVHTAVGSAMSMSHWLAEILERSSEYAARRPSASGADKAAWMSVHGTVGGRANNFSSAFKAIEKGVPSACRPPRTEGEIPAKSLMMAIRSSGAWTLLRTDSKAISPLSFLSLRSCAKTSGLLSKMAAADSAVTTICKAVFPAVSV